MVDLDDVFKLATPKYVYIRDRWLGMLKYTFMLLIFVYVVVYEILYTCDHLVPNHAGGYGSISMKQPVRDGSNNFRNIGELQYCTQATESAKKRLLKGHTDDDAEEDGKGKGKGGGAKHGGPEVGDFISEPRTCRYVDDDRLTLEETPNQVFIPMRYVSYTQEMDTACYDPLMKGFQGHTPKKDLNCNHRWLTKSTNEFFVADIGDYMLSFQHSFMAPDIGKAGVSTDFRGFMSACPTNHPADVKTSCKLMEVPNTSGEVAPEDLEGTVDPADLGISSLTGTSDGLDEISVNDLLRLTPVAQGHSWKEDIPDRKLPNHFGHSDTSLRESGGMLMLSVNYDNTGYLRPGIPGLNIPAIGLGGIKPITYTYRPYFIPAKSNKRVEVIQNGDASTHRTVNIWYGVTVQLSFEGKIVVFSWSQLLKGLTTGLVLLTSGTTIVIYLAIYIFKHKNKYLLQMYQYTEDMSNYKEFKPKAGQYCTSFTGEKLFKARGKGARTHLENNDITDILVDYEVRLNRLDGRDPKLAFIDNSDPEAGMKAFRELHQKHTKAFFDQGPQE